ncbi:MAG TPA: P1 family peptidase [Thermomicrobiales bacterium]|nr:P1 family peptidase [Thermomicrobiales bacterium]
MNDVTAAYTIGHWTDREALTGCTVVLFDRLVPAAFEARGGAPGTRETDLLRPSASVRSVDAIMLSGGSAPGLSSADGAIRYLRERQRGFPTAAGPIPIVSAAIVFDLAVGQAVSPNADNGYAACLAAVEPDSIERGAVGAGIGARVGTVDRSQAPRQGGFGAASVQTTAGVVSAYLVVNAAGEVITPDLDMDVRKSLLTVPIPGEGRESTTIGVVVTDAEVDHRTLERMTIAAHDGMSRMIRPCHTAFDGDAIFTVGLRHGSVDLRVTTLLGIATELAVEQAILDAVMMR